MISNLRFKLCHCSSESDNHQADLLTKYSKTSPGWVSAKWCEYPQDIVIQFDGKVRLKMLKLLSHESKIPKKVEIYVGRLDMKAHGDSLNYVNAQFKRIGYMSLDTNSASNFKARELKTAKLNDIVCSFLKLRIRECHVNKFNLFNQVGLYGIQVRGQLMKRFPKKLLAPLKEREIPTVKLEDLRPTKEQIPMDVEFELDEETKQLLESLSFRKEKAAEKENYKLAGQLKRQIENIKTVSIQLKALEQEKLKAVKREDYDRAEELKVRIGDIKAQKQRLDREAWPHNQPAPQQPSFDTQPPQQPSFHSQAAPSVNQSFEQQQYPSYPQQPSYQQQSYQSYGEPNQQSYVSHQSPFDDHPMAQEMFDQMQHQQQFNDDPYDMEPQLDPHQRMTRVFQPEDDLTPQKSPPPHSVNHSFQSIPENMESSFNREDNSGPLNGRIGKIPHDQKPVRPSKNNMYDFENVQDGDPFIEPQPVEDNSQVPNNNSVQQLGSRSTEEIIEGKEEWESNLIVAVREIQDEEPTKFQGVEDYQSFVAVFGDYITKCLHSSNRMLRESALKVVIDNFDTLPAEKSLIFSISMAYIKRGLKDKIPSVFYLSLEFLKLVVDMGQKECRRSTVSNAVQPLISILLKVIGDSHTRKNEMTKETIFFLADHTSVAPFTFRLFKLINPKSITWKPIRARTLMLAKFVEKYQFADQTGLTVQNCMNVAQGLFNHNRRELRTAAVVLTMRVYSVFAATHEGEDKLKIGKDFMNQYIPKKVKEALRAEIADKIMSDDPEYMHEVQLLHPGPVRRKSRPVNLLQSLEEDKQPVSPQSSKKKSSGNNDSKTPPPKSQQSPRRSPSTSQEFVEQVSGQQEETNPNDESIPLDDISDDDEGELPGNVCQFCLKTLDTDPDNPDVQVFNTHFTTECPMLEACPLCKMVIEIPDLTRHMLEECVHKDQVKQCPYCKLAIRKEEYENHVKQKKCTPDGNMDAQRCPLCAEPIPDGPEGWRMHLIHIGCSMATHGPSKFEI